MTFIELTLIDIDKKRMVSAYIGRFPKYLSSTHYFFGAFFHSRFLAQKEKRIVVTYATSQENILLHSDAMKLYLQKYRIQLRHHQETKRT